MRTYESKEKVWRASYCPRLDIDVLRENNVTRAFRIPALIIPDVDCTAQRLVIF